MAKFGKYADDGSIKSIVFKMTSDQYATLGLIITYKTLVINPQEIIFFLCQETGINLEVVINQFLNVSDIITMFEDLIEQLEAELTKDISPKQEVVE